MPQIHTIILSDVVKMVCKFNTNLTLELIIISWSVNITKQSQRFGLIVNRHHVTTVDEVNYVEICVVAHLLVVWQSLQQVRGLPRR